MTLICERHNEEVSGYTALKRKLAAEEKQKRKKQKLIDENANKQLMIVATGDVPVSQSAPEKNASPHPPPPSKNISKSADVQVPPQPSADEIEKVADPPVQKSHKTAEKIVPPPEPSAQADAENIVDSPEKNASNKEAENEIISSPAKQVIPSPLRNADSIPSSSHLEEGEIHHSEPSARQTEDVEKNVSTEHKSQLERDGK